jgi:hypothetical protein
MSLESECNQGRAAEILSLPKLAQGRELVELIGSSHPRIEHGRSNTHKYTFDCPAATEGCQAVWEIHAFGRIILQTCVRDMLTCRSE